MGTPLAILDVRVDCASPTIFVTGELDLTCCDDLRAAIDQLNDDALADVIIDIVGVTFLDGATMNVLDAAAERLRWTGRRLRVTGASRWAVRVLTIGGLQHLLEAADLVAVSAPTPGSALQTTGRARKGSRAGASPPPSTLRSRPVPAGGVTSTPPVMDSKSG